MAQNIEAISHRQLPALQPWRLASASRDRDAGRVCRDHRDAPPASVRSNFRPAPSQDLRNNPDAGAAEAALEELRILS
jgi:hypothetical protein